MTIGKAGTEPGKGTDRTSAVDRLLDRAVQALNHGDVAAAHELAATALSGDATDREAAALLAESAPTGELRRATLLFADLVGSTALSERHEPELYRGVVRRYTSLCRDVIEARYGGPQSFQGSAARSRARHRVPAAPKRVHGWVHACGGH